MDFALSEEHRMLKDLVAKFVKDALLPLEPAMLEMDAAGKVPKLSEAQRAPIDALSKEMGLWGLDAPADVGGSDLPMVAMVGVYEEMGRTITPYVLPPDSPNLRMLMATVNDAQRAQYLAPYAAGETISAIAISEPGAGADPAGMTTKAVRDGDDWVINGRKIWISKAPYADFTIAMAVTDPVKRARGGMSAFIIDKGTPGFNVLREIPMIGGQPTYEVVFEDCRVPASKLLGQEGQGFAPMQVRLSTRRLQMGIWGIALAQRALEMMVEHANQRVTFGTLLAERQSIQWWVADAATRIHAGRLMAYDVAWKLDQGMDVRTEISMLKVVGTELAWDVIDQAMQVFGAMGMTKELPLHLMASLVRTMRIYDGPSEVHRMVIARNVLGLKR
ncbi:acyl-CoA dehydrogenase family protein [Zavarzinia sp. CC-PAN008]|uniref:acyl-CoA dehydrogenase family protein n=1 Tax=Zavarzinia sp. CC-PAN008 TaxID=3243332 RepID=UPI003F749178